MNEEFMKRKGEVIKPNSIAEARGTYSKTFLDILDIVLQKVALENENPANLRYEFYIKDYISAFGLRFDFDAFRKLRTSVKAAYEKEPVITLCLDDDTEVDFRVFQEIKYSKADMKIEVMLTTRFKEQLIDLLEQKGKKIFYALPDTLQMKSEYSKKMYPVLLERVHKGPTDRMCFSGRGTQKGVYFDRIDSMEEFRALLNLPKSYKISNIKEMCALIMREIEEYTPYTARCYYNEYAPGRGRPGVTHICWTMERKEAPADKKKTVIRTDVSEVAQNESISDRVQWLMALAHLGEDSAASIIRKAEKYGRDDDYILKAYSTACSVGADSLGAMLSYFMNHEIENPVSVIKRERVELANERHLDYNAVAMEELMERLVFDDDEDGTKTGEPEFFEEAGSKKDIDGQLGFNV